MSNDINILVTTELGDTLVKLDLAKHAVNDLGDESEKTARQQEEAAASSTFFQGALDGLNSVMMASIPLFPGISAPLIALPVIAGAAAVAVVALSDAIGTLIAIAAAFVAPISVVTGLVGGLGVAFAIAAKKAFGMHEDGFGQAISGLKDQFSTLTKTLVGDFMPVFQFLIHNAHDALDFLNRIAKLPLNEAFRQLAQQGVPAVTKFLEQVGHMLAHPIRLAFQIAFGGGKGGNEAQAAVSQLWNQLSDFLFGYSKTHPIRLPSGQVIQLDKRHVDGIFQPLIDWFHRHKFTKEGKEIGQGIRDGILPSFGSIARSLVSDLADGFRKVHRAATQEWNHLTSELTHAMHRWNSEFESFVLSPFVSGWNKIRSIAGNALSAIVNRLGNVKSAIDGAVSLARRFWGVLQQIAGFFSRVFTFRVDWPSPPGWLNSVIGGAGDIVGKIPHSLPSLPGGGSGTVPWAMSGGNVVVVHVHGADLSDAAQQRKIGHQLGNTIFRQINQQTGV